jgi:hypothetical protein
MPDKPYKPLYAFSVTIGETRNRKMRTFVDLAEKLRMPVEDLMPFQCGSLHLHRNGLAPSTPCRPPGALQKFPFREVSTLRQLSVPLIRNTRDPRWEPRDAFGDPGS